MNGKKLTQFLHGFLLVAACTFRLASAQTTFVIPHFAADELEDTIVPVTSIDVIDTDILVVNPSQLPAEVMIEAFDDDGNPIPAGTRSSRTIPPGGLEHFRIISATPVSGWLKVSTDPQAVVRGSIGVFRLFSFDSPPFDFSLLTDTDADPAEAFSQGSVPVKFVHPGNTTGIAVVYPAMDGAAPNNLSLTLRNSDGETLGSVQIQVPPNGRRTFLLQDLFPFPQILQIGFEGTLEISADSPVYGTTIEYQARPVVWRTVEFAVAR